MRLRLLATCVVLIAIQPTLTSAVTIDMVTVGNPGNAPDTRYNATGFGSVGYSYQIGKYEVTAGQYTEFLNAVAKDDPNGLYNLEMDLDANPTHLGANIKRTGSDPNYSYSVAADRADRPVNYVGFSDAARFANWLDNGQPTGAQGPGTTEDGAYHDVDNQALFGRNAGARYFLPTEDEWYKAAYHNQSAGLAASYFDWPTGTNALPGREINDTTNAGNNANYYNNGYVIGSPFYSTVAGEFELSDSPYGTFDQGGNVFEWNETGGNSSGRGQRGGSFGHSVGQMHASFHLYNNPNYEFGDVGFRMAGIASIPEPSTLLLIAAAIGLFARRRRRRINSAWFYHWARVAVAFALVVGIAFHMPSAARADIAVGWGNAHYGELGDGALEYYQRAPVAVIGLTSGVTKVAPGYEHSLVIDSGAAFAFGYNGDGQLGIGVETFSQPTPVAVIGLTSGVTDVDAGWFHSLAVKNGGAYAWGGNYDGQLGGGEYGKNPAPVAVTGLASGVTDVAAGAFFSMAIKNGGLYAWGYNGYGELGNGTSANKTTTPAPVSGLTTGVTDISGGNHHSLAVKDGGVYAWGGNFSGQIGNGTILTGSPYGVLIPTPVSGLTSGVTNVAAGAVHSLAVKEGFVYAWGDNLYGQIGDGTTTARLSPVPIDPADVNNIVAVAAGALSSYALSSDGSLWVWGGNPSGQLGLGTDVEMYLTPQHLLPPPGYTFTSINSGTGHALATLAAVPEPSTLLLLWFGSLAVLRRRRGIVCASVLAVAVCAATSVHAADIRTVALTGAVFDRFDNIQNLVLNDAGQVAFLANSGSSTWSEGSGNLALVVTGGLQAPGLPDGVTFSGQQYDVQGLVLNDAGQTAFGASAGSRGIWSEGSGSLALVARGGDHAPGTPSGVNFNSIFSRPVLNNAGQTSFSAQLTGSGVDGTNSRGIWSEGSGTLALVARAGDHAPGTPSGVNYVFDSARPALNDVGHTAFRGQLTGAGVDSTNNFGIWSERSGTLALVIRSGSQAPGTADGVNFRDFQFSGPSDERLAFNNQGQTAFQATITGGGVDGTNNTGIWSEGSGSLALVAREGHHAAGTDSGVNYSVLSFPVLNNAGQTAFEASLTGSGVDATNDSGIWIMDSGVLTSVARSGDHAPGTPNGINFSTGGALGSFQSQLNDAGQVAFYANLTDGGQGIWATDRSGNLQLIVRTGELLEVTPGDFRTIIQLNVFSPGLTGNGDGRPSAFNNLGQLVFSVSFTDATAGVFVSNRVAVPEPSTLLLLCFGGLAVLWRRRGLLCASVLSAALVGLTAPCSRADSAVA